MFKLMFQVESGFVARMFGTCVVTGEEYSVRANLADVQRWQEGELIQNAMPYLSAEDREFLMSGISPKGWKQTFGEDE